MTLYYLWNFGKLYFGSNPVINLILSLSIELKHITIIHAPKNPVINEYKEVFYTPTSLCGRILSSPLSVQSPQFACKCYRGHNFFPILMELGRLIGIGKILVVLILVNFRSRVPELLPLNLRKYVKIGLWILSWPQFLLITMKLVCLVLDVILYCHIFVLRLLTNNFSLVTLVGV